MSYGFPIILRNLNGSWYLATSAHTLSTLFTRPVHEFHALGFSALSIKGDKKGTLAPPQLMAIVIGWENGAIFNMFNCSAKIGSWNRFTIAPLAASGHQLTNWTYPGTPWRNCPECNPVSETLALLWPYQIIIPANIYFSASEQA